MVLGTPVLAIAVALVGCREAAARRHLRPGAGGRPDPVPAPLLVLLAPGGLHHGAAGDGRCREIVPCFCRRPIFGYRLIAFSSLAIAVLGFLVWGHHMFVSGQSMYAGMVFSVLSFLVAVPVGDQGVQLDGHDVQGLDPAGHADALCARVHRPVHDGRADRADAGHAGDRRARARHLFRGGPLPLHHGGRRGDGLHGRRSTSGGPR